MGVIITGRPLAIALQHHLDAFGELGVQARTASSTHPTPNPNPTPTPDPDPNPIPNHNPSPNPDQGLTRSEFLRLWREGVAQKKCALPPKPVMDMLQQVHLARVRVRVRVRVSVRVRVRVRVS